MTKDEKLQKFVEHLKEDQNTLAVILFGSHAKGNSRPDSDIDLVVILKEGYKRAADFFEDQAFEIIYTTEKSAIEYWQGNKHDALGLWMVAKLLFDRDGTGRRLSEFGEMLCKEKPSEMNESQIAHLKFDLADSFKAIEMMKGDKSTASFLLNKKVFDLTDLYFDLKREWRPAPKQRILKIRSENSQLGKLLDDFYTNGELDHKIAIAKEITTAIFS